MHSEDDASIIVDSVVLLDSLLFRMRLLQNNTQSKIYGIVLSVMIIIVIEFVFN